MVGGIAGLAARQPNANEQKVQEFGKVVHVGVFRLLLMVGRYVSWQDFT
ncbi:hypothetical protein GCM10023156_09740 [Novipirellula rosea]|uniref:Uncharacterized protein n=1 Tax=Novipirellula rosea TaxID=1031540 RepID=A0ABP8ME41_9BACT